MRASCLAIAATFLSEVHAQEPRSAAAKSALTSERISGLKPGQFIWRPEVSASGPVVLVVSIPEQRAYVYRNGLAIGASTVSTGKTGHDTPSGVFTILEKRVKHESNIYKGAQMPYMERLTWSGIALHAGKLPGFPASHGCVRLPLEFSRLLYGVTSKGSTVVIADAKSSQAQIIHPGLLSPVTPSAANDVPSEGMMWQPEKAASGPVSILISRGDLRVYVYRDGVLIGAAPLTIREPDLPLGEDVFTMLEGDGSEPSVYVPGKPSKRWMAVTSASAPTAQNTVTERVRVPAPFARQVYDILAPGTTVVVTDATTLPSNRTAPGFTIISTEGK